MAQSEQLAGWLGIPWAKISLSIVVLMLAGMVVRHVWDRRWLNKNPKPAPAPEGGAA
jgi:hypothetical protein